MAMLGHMKDDPQDLIQMVELQLFTDEIILLKALFRAEYFMTIAVSVTHKEMTQEQRIIDIVADSDYYRLFDDQLNKVGQIVQTLTKDTNLPGKVLISRKLAKIIEILMTETVEFELPPQTTALLAKIRPDFVERVKNTVKATESLDHAYGGNPVNINIFGKNKASA